MTVAREISFGEYYHVFNRGAHKANLFKDEHDWLRFLFLILHCQSDVALPNIRRYLKSAALEEGFRIPKSQLESIEKNKLIELVAFCIMPNHFHLLLKETTEGAISAYMQRLSTGYAMYFNTKYKAAGHLFESRYKNVHVQDNDQLLYLSAYIHRNPRELAKWKGYELAYPYSSFQDMVEENRWGSLLSSDILISQFDGTKQSNYLDFVNSSTAKTLEDKIPTSSVEL